MYIIPTSTISTSASMFTSTNDDKPLPGNIGVQKLTALLNSGFAQISPCTEKYAGHVTVHAAQPMRGRHKENYLAFLGPEKALRALVQDVRNDKPVSEDLLQDIFHIQ